MSKTRVINITDAPENWRDDDRYVLINRRTKWGNRHRIGPLSRREVIERFREDGPPDDLEELRGKILMCHCKPLECHGDVYVEWLELTEEAA